MIEQPEIQKAAKILASGGLVAIPTETVYGLGADASNPAALLKIFAAKGRPVDHPLIVHLASVDQVPEWAASIPPKALKLARAFWPGPLTLILKKAPHVLDLITGGQETVGLRVPNHPLALEVLKAFGGGVAAPSANRFGRISPTSAAAVREELGDTVDMILEGGQCVVGVESTIVDVSNDEITILRPGMITAEDIENVLQEKVRTTQKNSPRVSGSLEQHYAPRTKTKIMSQAEIPAFLKSLSGDELPVVVLGLNEEYENVNVEWIKMSKASDQYAHDLYRTLREMDKRDFKMIIIEEVPSSSDWAAIRDRLTRASA